MSKNPKAEMDNRSRQLNPEDATYYASRGEPVPPDVGPLDPVAAPAAPQPAPKQVDTKSGK